MVRVVYPATTVDHDLGIATEDRVRPEGSNLPDQHLAQGQVVDQASVGLVKERDTGIAHDLGGAQLLVLSGPGQVERIEVGVLPSGVARRAADEPAFGPGDDPGRGRARRPEVGVIRVADDDHEPPRSPGVDRRHLFGHIPISIAKSSLSEGTIQGCGPRADLWKSSPRIAEPSYDAGRGFARLPPRAKPLCLPETVHGPRD